MTPDYAGLTDQELLNKLDDAAFVDRFEHSEEWKMLREAGDRLAKQATYRMLKTDPIKDPTAIIECQITIKLCQNILRGIINGIKTEGAIAFKEAKERGLNLPLSNA